MPFTSTAVLVSSTVRPGTRGSGYKAMRKEFRELFDSNRRGDKSAVRIVRACIEDTEASWEVRLKAIEFAAKYGFGMPERMDDEQIIVMAERKLEQRIAEARAALGPIEVTPVEPKVEVGVSPAGSLPFGGDAE